MNEKTVLKNSLWVFLVGCLLLSVIGLFFRDISYLGGFILGYIINVLVFVVIMKMSEGILKLKMSTVIIAIMSIVKLLLYAVGFYISVKVSWIHILGVFLGYFVMKITIYAEGYVHKGGEVDGS